MSKTLNAKQAAMMTELQGDYFFRSHCPFSADIDFRKLRASRLEEMRDQLLQVAKSLQTVLDAGEDVPERRAVIEYTIHATGQKIAREYP